MTDRTLIFARQRSSVSWQPTLMFNKSLEDHYYLLFVYFLVHLSVLVWKVRRRRPSIGLKFSLFFSQTQWHWHYVKSVLQVSWIYWTDQGMLVIAFEPKE